MQYRETSTEFEFGYIITHELSKYYVDLRLELSLFAVAVSSTDPPMVPPQSAPDWAAVII